MKIKQAIMKKNKEDKEKEKHKAEQQKEQARAERMKVQAYLKQLQEMESLEQMKDIEKKSKLIQTTKQKEQERIVKLQKAEEFQKEMIFQRREKQEEMQKQNEEKAQRLIKQQQTKKKIMGYRSKLQQERAINLRETLKIEEENKNKEINTKRKLDYLRDEKIKVFKENFQRRLSEKGQQQISKIQEAIAASETHIKMRKRMLLNKQSMSEKRMQKQKQLLKEEQIERKQIKEALLEIKRLNMERMKRKSQYSTFLVQSRITQSDEKVSEFVDHRNKVKMLKILNQTQGMNKRDTMRKAFYHMAVWKVYDTAIINNLLERNVMSPSATIETIIRSKAAEFHNRKRLFPLKSARYAKSFTNFPPQNSQKGASSSGNAFTNFGTPPLSDSDRSKPSPIENRDEVRSDCL